MASWKKVIVSGSQASLAGLSGSALTDGKLVFASGDAGALTSVTGVDANGDGHLDGIFSGSFSGSFEGDGGGLTNLSLDNTLTDGNGIADFSFNGSADATVAIELSGSTLTVDTNGVAVAEDGITAVEISSSAVGDGLTGGSGTPITVDLSGSTLTVSDEGLAVAEDGITTTEIADDSIIFDHLSGSAVVTGAEGISAATTGSDDNLATTKAIKDYVDAQVGGATLNITGSGDTAVSVDLNDEDLIFAGESGVMSVSSSVADGDVTITTAIVDGGIGNAKLANNSVHISGSGISAASVALGATASIDVQVDNTTIEIDGDSLQLVNDSIKIGDASFALGTTASLADTKFNSGSFSGSFEGDGSGLTGIASTLNIDVKENAADTTTEDVTIDLLTDSLVIQGVANEISASASGDVITIGLPDDVTINNDLTVEGDLVVQGDMTTLNTTNLNIEDQFILLNSGSDGADVDTGIVFGGTDGTANSGKAVYYDAGDDKFGFSGEIASNATTGTLSQYMGAIELAAADPTDGTVGVQGAGTIHVNTSSEDIFIYV